MKLPVLYFNFVRVIRLWIFQLYSVIKGIFVKKRDFNKLLIYSRIIASMEAINSRIITKYDRFISQILKCIIFIG